MHIRCLVFSLLLLLFSNAQADDAQAVVDTLLESLGGKQVWAEARAIYIRETAYPASMSDPVNAKFWRDLEKPIYRSVLTAPGTERKTWRTATSGWSERNGERSETSACLPGVHQRLETGVLNTRRFIRSRQYRS